MHKFIKGGAKVSALSFIAAHREWLEAGSLGEMTAPVLARLDAGEIFPTPALRELQQIALDHHLTRQISAGKAKAERAGKGGTPAKPYLAKVFSAGGEVAVDSEGEEISESHESAFKAHGWVNRRLDQGSPGWWGEVVDTRTGIAERVDRDQALAALYRDRPGAGAVTKRTATGSGSMRPQMRVKGDHFHFSRG